MLKLLARDALSLTEVLITHPFENGSCPQFPYWEIELKTHVSNVRCMSVERPQGFAFLFHANILHIS